jgi:hypothetical protein
MAVRCQRVKPARGVPPRAVALAIAVAALVSSGCTHHHGHYTGPILYAPHHALHWDWDDWHGGYGWEVHGLTGHGHGGHH